MTAIDWKRVQTRLAAAGFDPGPIDGAPGMSNPKLPPDIKTMRAVLSYAAHRDVGEFGTKAAPICIVMFAKYDISDHAESLAQFLATTSHETGDFTVFSENLYYTTPARIVKNWPTRFNMVTALTVLRNPRKLAEAVYSFKARGGTKYDLGNRPDTTDAYDMRGGGWIQTTGYDNYARAARVTSLPLVEHPELLHDPLTSIEPACAYWKGMGCNELALANPSGRRSRIKVNGGTIGLEDVLTRTSRMMGLLA